jgi:hypothetical protein
MHACHPPASATLQQGQARPAVFAHRVNMSRAELSSAAEIVCSHKNAATPPSIRSAPSETAAAAPAPAAAAAAAPAAAVAPAAAIPAAAAVSSVSEYSSVELAPDVAARQAAVTAWLSCFSSGSSSVSESEHPAPRSWQAVFIYFLCFAAGTRAT